MEMKRCLICGRTSCGCSSPDSGPTTATGNIFGDLSAPAPGKPSEAIFRDSAEPAKTFETEQTKPAEAVWVSAKLEYFRAPASRWPDDIGFVGFENRPDGVYRKIDGFYLGWLVKRIQRLEGYQRADARERLRDIVTEAINAGCLPEAFDDPAKWPRTSPADYGLPVLENSTDYFPVEVV